MLKDLTSILDEATVNYPIHNSALPFTDYIACSRRIVENRRTDLHLPDCDPELIIDCNSPYELYPTRPILSGKKIKYGVLLTHGLLDCPFSLRDIANHLNKNGMLCRSILLPGHGTHPADLLTISYHHWIQAVRYGIDSLQDEVEQIFLVGFSTGAALSIYHAMQNHKIAGLILLAPAIRIKAPIDLMIGSRYLLRWFSNNKKWLHKETEVDYTKYLSIAFNPVHQVSQLTEVINESDQQRKINCPIFMSISHEDETISSKAAIHFFKHFSHAKSHLLLYSASEQHDADTRIETRRAVYPSMQIKHFSHVSIPFAPNNHHYGEHGDYLYTSRMPNTEYIFGAYNYVEYKVFAGLKKFGCIQKQRRELTFNPDFDYLMQKINNFILTSQA